MDPSLWYLPNLTIITTTIVSIFNLTNYLHLLHREQHDKFYTKIQAYGIKNGLSL